MGPTRINTLVADIAGRNYSGPGEIRTRYDAGQVLLIDPDGEDIRHWDFWIGIEHAAEAAPSEREAFVEHVAGAVSGSAEAVLLESNSAL